MAHLIILLGGWDWIQLSNVHKIVLKHGVANVNITTLLPASLTPALAALVNNDKIHVVGHGGPNVFDVHAGTTPTGLADLIHADLPVNTTVKIRVDTCSSADDAGGGATTARTIRDRLVVDHGRDAAHISVSGTLGPSVTGAPGQRIVVNGAQVAQAANAQTMLERLHANSITRAEAAVLNVALASTDAQIKTQAERVYFQTKQFFEEFAALLNRRAGLAVTHVGGAHKVTY
jgi:hypothetical protein